MWYLSDQSNAYIVAIKAIRVRGADATDRTNIS